MNTISIQEFTLTHKELFRLIHHHSDRRPYMRQIARKLFSLKKLTEKEEKDFLLFLRLNRGRIVYVDSHRKPKDERIYFLKK